MHRIAVIGDADSILGFKALGIEVFSVNDPDQAATTLRSIAKEDFGVIFVTEGIAFQIIDDITEYSQRALPAVLTIPDNKGTTGAALEKIRRTVEKALGADILFGKEKEGSDK